MDGVFPSGRLRRSPIFVLVAGPPGSGKSSVAGPLAKELGLPLLAKDEIKEALMSELGRPGTVEESRRLGRAAVIAMLTVARSAPGAVLDSTFYPYTVAHLTELPGHAGRAPLPLPDGRSPRRGTRPGARPGTPGTSTTSGRPRSCGTSTIWSRSGSVR